MSQKFIVALDGGTPKGWHVWHWIGDFWLLAGAPVDVTSRSLASELKNLSVLAHSKLLVLKVDGDPAYWGYISTDAWPWMAQHWGRPETPSPVPSPPELARPLEEAKR